VEVLQFLLWHIPVERLVDTLNVLGHPFATAIESNPVILVDQPPTRAGIDPQNKLIDTGWQTTM
jgi:hypothetical protein